LAASTLAGDSSLGDDSMAMMEMTMDSTCTQYGGGRKGQQYQYQGRQGTSSCKP
jgi:hypothetical protein